MITKENIHDIIGLLTEKELIRIENSSKDYLVLELHCGNASAVVIPILTNNYLKYQNVSNSGNAIFEREHFVSEYLTLA